MKRLITIPLALTVGIISMIAAGMLGLGILMFEIADRLFTPIIRKMK
jgi:hypothetical protein